LASYKDNKFFLDDDDFETDNEDESSKKGKMPIRQSLSLPTKA
jgi:hypothetical protein